MPTTPRDPVRRARPFAVLAVTLACVPALLFPGDAPFINDEAFLVLNALRSNAAGRLAEVGLTGTKGLPYGPLPTWVYQGLLAITHDPVALAFLHAALVAGVTAAALLSLSRALGLPAAFAPVLLVSPYVWFYARVLWDNPLLLPLSAVAVAAHADFLARRRPLALSIAIAAALASLLVHLMALALAVPLLAHAAATGWRTARRHPWVLAAPALLAVAAAPYGRALWAAAGAGQAPRAAPALEGFLFPLQGPRLLGATGLATFLGPGWLDARLAAIAAASAVVFPLAWAGAALAVARIARAARAGTAGPREHVAAVALAALAAQSLLDGLARAYGFPHYGNATWIAWAVLAWLAVDAVARFRAARAGLALVGASLAAVTLGLVVSLHRTAGTRAPDHGPAIGTQVEVVRALDRFAPGTPVEVRVENLERYPHALEAIRALLPARRGEAAARRVVVRWASQDPRDAHVVVEAE